MAEARKKEKLDAQQHMCGECWLEHNDTHCRCNVANVQAAPTCRSPRERREEEQLELF